MTIGMTYTLAIISDAGLESACIVFLPCKHATQCSDKVCPLQGLNNQIGTMKLFTPEFSIHVLRACMQCKKMHGYHHEGASIGTIFVMGVPFLILSIFLTFVCYVSSNELSLVQLACLLIWSE